MNRLRGRLHYLRSQGHALARAQVGYVSERTDHEYGWMTCGALLSHVAAYYPAWDHAYSDRLNREFGLRLDHKVGTLSKGESRRLQLMLALAHRPPVLLLDEPMDGLDPVIRHRTLSLLRWNNRDRRPPHSADLT